MDPNLPATRSEPPVTSDERHPPLATQRPVNVALLPLAIASFVVLAFVIATWTFVATAF